MGFKVPAPGVWTPAVTFFSPSSGQIDVEAQKKYFAYLSKHVTGLVVLGSNAEAFLLTREERITLVKTAREAVGPGKSMSDHHYIDKLEIV